MRFSGAQHVRLSASGDLLVDDMIQKRPVIYQENPRREIAGRYVLLGRNTVGVRVADYDRSRQLVIDPVLSYLTYMGGTGTDRINAAKLYKNFLYVTGQIANQDLSATDNAYKNVTAGRPTSFWPSSTSPPAQVIRSHTSRTSAGRVTTWRWRWMWTAMASRTLPAATNSADFPIGGGFQTTGRGTTLDAFVLLLDPNTPGGDALLYSTYLGGPAADDVGNGIAVGPDGVVYIVGTTRSSDFPVTASAYQPVLWGAQDAFIAKVDPHPGAPLVYSTFLGGESQDDGRAILVDAKGLVYFGASTTSENFPMAGAQYRGVRVGAEDVIVGVMDLTKSGAGFARVFDVLRRHGN